ncbi:L,D-transpeptidase [Catenuloplanes atrovinosus]|uniref:Lipoprotein-anchoring transpeptidase ErfK/SrfK n=1 Tax=Catenuloplanes atrovinosus TaxID=137266 RepID=A0AAE4CD48_9ACTN|nr:Ig-like domain-containing protein [Catenuloplanes atrovinosus]MDR7279838.1 lipoprotein-anchoring transpeptidase ErfK/SrfK [Catenuloplanes atrovinosus]
MRLRTRALSLALVPALALGLAACGNDASEQDGGGAPTAPASTAAAPLAVTPADRETNVPVSAEIGVKEQGVALTEVTLTDGAGATVEGGLRADGSTWVPADPLAYDTTYTVRATAGDRAATSTFTTMSRPGNRMDAQIFMADGKTYGQAMPIVVEFGQGGVKEADRAAVERRLFVQSDPPQLGVWHWDSDIQVEYRPEKYWQPGTKLTVRLGLGGLPVGGGRYGKVDVDLTASIDTKRREIQVDNATKKMTAVEDGKTLQTYPVSLGKKEAPSFSGTMVIIERLEKTTFDSSTYGVPASSADGYRTDVQYAERLTWSGQFIHAAPWSDADQGRRNVSHGCVNVSTGGGKWIFDWTRVGDPVVIKGTEEQLPVGDGWTAWNMSWEDFKAGSALS